MKLRTSSAAGARLTRRSFVGAGSIAIASIPAAAGAEGLRTLGAPRREYGDRSQFERSARLFPQSSTPMTGSSRSPLQDQFGIITPSSLHFERHHSGVPALDPEQGYPLRLLVPGWEGNVSVKWLHRLHVIDQPMMTRDEAASYTDLMPDGKARSFSFEMEANSVITSPSGGQYVDGRGWTEISGLAWSGRGRIEQVDVSTDGGATWSRAELQAPVLSKAFTRFRLPWRWDGQETILVSRSRDETGYIQPSREAIVTIRGMKEGPDGFNHFNGMKPWKLGSDGRVTHV